MKLFLHPLSFLILILFLANTAKAQVFTGTGGAISNDSLPNFYAQTVAVTNTSIDNNYGVYGVMVNISHTYDADLNIFLIAPNNYTVELSTKNGGAGDNYSNCIFTANTSVKINIASAPFTGSFKPEGSLGIVNNGQNPNGTWKLLIVDAKKSADAGTLLNWSLIFSSNPSKLIPFTSSNLPLMLINTYNQYIPDEPKVAGRMRIISNDTSLNYLSDSSKFYNHKIGIESRGSSSQSFPKRPYGFFTVDGTGADSNTTLIGLPAEHNWVLNASYNDKSLMRDMLTYELARRTGRYASRYRYCELFINGEYVGLYLLMEKVKRDANRVDISKLKPEDTTGNNLTGGYIVKIDKTTGNYSGGWTDTFPTYPGSNQRVFFQYDYPEEAVMAPQQKAYIKNNIYLFETALSNAQFTNPTTGYRQYADVGSFIDYSLMNEISKNVDGYRLSTYLYKDKDTKAGKLMMGPIWDFSIAWGNADYNNSYSTAGWEIDLSSGSPFWWKRFRQDTAYVNAQFCRWNELRTSTLSFEGINNFIDSTTHFIKEATYRNFQRWPILGVYIWPNPAPLSYTFEDEVYNLKAWIYNRCLWMDNQLSATCSSRLACKAKVVVSSDKTTVCKNQSVKLVADGIGSIFTWSPSTGLNTTTGRNVIATLDTTRTYKVVMQTSNGCSDTNFITIYTAPLPAKGITGNTSICKGTYTVLTATSGASNYKWTPSSTLDTPFGISVKASPTLNTTYKVVATNAYGCSDSSYITVIVNQIPLVKITASQDSVCVNYPITLTASGASTYKWLPANGLTDSTGTTVVVHPTQPTIYKVIGFSAQGCFDTAKLELNFHSFAPIKTHASDTQICVGKKVTLSATSGSSFQWLPTNGFNGSSNDSITVAPLTTTLYKVTGVNIYGCIDTVSILIKVSSLPQVSITTSDTMLCWGNAVVLNAHGADTYHWLAANGLNDSVGDNVSVNPLTTTTYTVIGINAGGCLDSSMITIYVSTKPQAVIAGKNRICKGESTTLTASGGNTYQWYPAFGLNSTNAAQVIASPTNNSTYHVIVISSNQCRDTAQIQIVVDDIPAVVITPAAPTINKGQTVNLSASGATTYQWSPALGLNTTSGNTVIASPIVTTTYSVVGSDTNQCKSTKMVTVNVTTTGIYTNSMEVVKFLIFPNPVGDKLEIMALQVNTNYDLNVAQPVYRIYDLAGKILLNGEIYEMKKSINISSLSSGVYILKLSDSDGLLFVTKFVKEY